MYAGAIRILLIVILTLINVWILESYKFDTVDDHINNVKDFNVLDLEAANGLQKTPQYPSSAQRLRTCTKLFTSWSLLF